MSDNYPAETKYLLCQSWLSWKKTFSSQDRIVVLCCPQTILDVQHCFETFFTNDPTRPIDHRSIPYLGNIAVAATKGTPLLIVLPAERTQNEQPLFFHLDNLTNVSDEVALKQACSFSLTLGGNDLKFMCKTSTDYQTWMHFLTVAFEMVAQHISDKDCKRKTRYLELVELAHDEQVESTLARPTFSGMFQRKTSPLPMSESPVFESTPYEE